MKIRKGIKSIALLAAVGITALFFINISFANNIAKIKDEMVNLRETANAEAKILKQLSKNDEIEIIEEGEQWCKVKSGELTGYIRKDLLEITKSANTDTNIEATEAEDSVNNTAETQTLDNNDDSNQEVNNIDTNNSDEEQLETTKIVLEDTTLKIVPVINATNIVEVKKDEEVEIIETINGWVCIQTQSAKGWIRSEKLKSKAESAEVKQQEDEHIKDDQETMIKTMFIASETVNLRKEPNATAEIITKLALNVAVDVYSEEGGWSKVKVSGKEGYVSTSLLSDKKKETSRASDTPRSADSKSSNSEVKEEAAASQVSSTKNGGSIVETAKSYIGKAKYVYGASGPNSFDCSGFTSYVYKQYGVSLSRTAAGQYSNGVAVSKDQLQPGDLVMFGKSGINHVGIYIGGGQMVHAANSSRGITTDTINSGYYGNSYVGARRVN